MTPVFPSLRSRCWCSGSRAARRRARTSICRPFRRRRFARPLRPGEEWQFRATRLCRETSLRPASLRARCSLGDQCKLWLSFRTAAWKTCSGCGTPAQSGSDRSIFESRSRCLRGRSLPCIPAPPPSFYPGNRYGERCRADFPLPLELKPDAVSRLAREEDVKLHLRSAVSDGGMTVDHVDQVVACGQHVPPRAEIGL